MKIVEVAVFFGEYIAEQGTYRKLTSDEKREVCKRSNNHDALVEALKAMTYDYAMIAGYGDDVPKSLMEDSKGFAGPTKIELIQSAMKLLSKLESE